MLFLRCVECSECPAAESESSVDRTVEVKQTMHGRLLQYGSRLCRHCVLCSCTMLWHGLGSDTSQNQTLKSVKHAVGQNSL